jgi:hypothetical protein
MWLLKMSMQFHMSSYVHQSYAGKLSTGPVKPSADGIVKSLPSYDTQDQIDKVRDSEDKSFGVLTLATIWIGSLEGRPWCNKCSDGVDVFVRRERCLSAGAYPPSKLWLLE